MKVIEGGEDRLTLNVAAFRKNCRASGPRVRDTIWLQGCRVGCPGCANYAYLPHEPRRLLSVERLKEHFAARVGKIDGVSVTGGEPTEQVEPLIELLASIKLLGMSTVVYTGRLYQELKRESIYRKLLEVTDILIDGPYVREASNPSLRWRGSDNQDVIRLSCYFSVEELDDGCHGEIFVAPNMISFHGVGTRGLLSDSLVERGAG